MIEISNVSKSFKNGKKVIKNLNLKINDGEIFGFIGVNGAGKTTTIKMMTGILAIDDGKILIDNVDIEKMPVEAKKKIGLVPDSPDIFLKLKGIEYLKFIADVYEVSEFERVERIKKLCEIFNMENELNNKIEKYSHGMRQKIIIMGALLHQPKNLILDEPITGLDPKSTFDLKNILRQYAKEGNTVFFSTHILDIAEKLCDKVGIIDNGELVYTGNIENLKEKYLNEKSLEDIFMKIIKGEKNWEN